MSNNILVVIVIAIFSSIVLAAVAKEFRYAFQASKGYAGLLHHKTGKAGSPELKAEDGAS